MKKAAGEAGGLKRAGNGSSVKNVRQEDPETVDVVQTHWDMAVKT